MLEYTDYTWKITVKHFLYSALILLLSCNCSPGKHNNTIPDTASRVHNPILDSLRKNIHFEYSAKFVDLNNRRIEVTAHLFNDNDTAAYFLTGTCDSDQYWLNYDTSQVTLTATIQCNASYPILAEIKSDSGYLFKATFFNKSNSTNLQLGFYFYGMNRPQELDNLNWIDCARLIRHEKNLIPGKEIAIAAFDH